MANVYSDLLAEWESPSGGGAQRFAVPAGYRWVVRSLDLYCGSSQARPATGFTVADDFGAVIFALDLPWTWTRSPYHWEGRQVVLEGSGLNFFAVEFQWQFRASGYQLKLP